MEGQDVRPRKRPNGIILAKAEGTRIMTRPPADRTCVDRFRRWVPVFNVVMALYLTASVTVDVVRGDWSSAAFFGIFAVGFSAQAVIHAWPAPFPRRRAIGLLVGPVIILCLMGALFGALGTYGLVVGRRPWFALAGLAVAALCLAGGVYVFNKLRKLQYPGPGSPGF